MSVIQEQANVTNIGLFLLQQEGAIYGRANAKLLSPEDHNKSARVMVRRVENLFQGLFLSATMHRSAIFHDNGNSFAGIELGDREYFVMARDLMDERKLPDVLQGEKPSITIVSGPCLFSAQAVQAISEQGSRFSVTTPGVEITEKIERLEVSDTLSLYEIESVTRLSEFINGLVRSSDTVRGVQLNIPQAEYYAYLLDAYTKGFVTQEQMALWMLHVDMRQAKLANMMKKGILQGVANDRSIAINQIAPLNPIREYMADAVLRNENPSLEESLVMLRQNSPLWEALLDIEEPASWQEINHLSYVFAELQSGLPSEDASGDGVPIGIVVESPTESKIFANAKKIIGKMNGRYRGSVLALYPHEMIIPVDGNTGKTMYHLVETDEMRQNNLQIIFQAYKDASTGRKGSAS